MPVTQAPAGGMVVNNLFTRGGRFTPSPLARVGRVMDRLRKSPLLGRLSRYTTKELLAPLGDEVPWGESMTLPQLHAIEEHHGIPESHRLSNKVTVKADGRISADSDDVIRFLHHTRRYVAKKTPNIRYKTPEQAAALMVDHLGAETGHALLHPHGQDATRLYGDHVQHLTDVVGEHFGWAPKDPRHTLFKALVATTSSGQNPKANAKLAFKILREAGGDFSKLPARQDAKLSRWKETFRGIHGAYPSGIPDPRRQPQEASAWYHRYVAPHPELHDGYTGAPASFFSHPTDPGHPKNGRVAAVQRNNKWVATDEGAGLWAEAKRAARATKKEAKRHFRKAEFPLPDAAGDPRPKSWSQRGEGIVEGVETLRTILRHFKGDHQKAADFLLSEHTPEQIRKVTGETVNAGYLRGLEKYPGTFALGPKFGPFTLNLHASTHPEMGKYLTPDLWWSRTYNRFLGTLVAQSRSGRPTIREQPKSDAERRAMYRAAKLAAEPLGLTVAELQATLWYHEQHLHKLFGAKAVSYSYKDGADEIKKLIASGVDTEPDDD